MIRFFANHKTAANLLMIMVFLLGALGTMAMLRETFPQFAPDKVIVQVVYQGASSLEVEDSICSLIEEALEGVEGVEQVVSSATEGMGQVTLEMQEGYKLDQFYRDIKNEIDKIDSWPDRAETPLVFIQKKKDPVITLAIGGEIPFRDLKEYGRRIRSELLKNPAISLVDLSGVSEILVKIRIPKDTLQALGLSIAQVKNTILEQSENLPLGTIESGEREILLRMVDQKYSPEEFGRIVLFSAKGGSQIRLSDIAHITWEPEKKEEVIYLNGKRAVVLSIQRSPREDALVIEGEVKKFVKKHRDQLPEGMEIRTTENVASVVQDRLTLLVKNALQGFVLVFFTLWLFLNIRMAFWVAMGIPFSFLGALWLMELYGLTLNMITMVSLLLGLGLIVDDAIVIGENIFAHHQRGEGAFQACIKGVSGVFSGVVCSFLTTFAAFMPLIFMKGNMGKILSVLPIGVILALFISLIEAFLILPNHLSHSLKKQREESWLRKKIEGVIQYFIQDIFSRVVSFCLKNRYFITGCTLGLFVISLAMVGGGRVAQIPFPDLDGDVIVCNVLLPAGTPLEKTKKLTEKISKALWQIDREWTPLQPERKHLIKNVMVRLGNNMELKESGPHTATISVELLTSEKRNRTCDDIIEQWRKKVGNPPDAPSLHFAQLTIGPAGKAFEVEFKGRDFTMLKTASKEFQRKLSTYQGVYNVMDNLNPGKLELRISTLPRARQFGFTSRDISSQLSASFFGAKVEDFQIGTENIEVRVQLSDRDRMELHQVENFYLLDRQGLQIPLGHLAKISVHRGYSKIYHIDGQRTVTVTADLNMRKGNSSTILADFKKDTFPKMLRKYPGLEISFGGQERQMKKTLPSARKGFLLGIVFIFLILSFVFQSYFQPLTIMIAIPFGLAGAILGHYFMGLDLSMPSIVGVVSLSGIVVNDSIVLIQFMNENLQEGLNPIKAASQASIARFRAVFLTSATTIAGLIPLLAERSVQAQILIPLATSLAFGLLFSTFLVLLFIPCLTAIFYDFGFLRNQK